MNSLKEPPEVEGVHDAPHPEPVTRGPALRNTTDARLKLVIESAPVGLIVTAPDGKVLAANKSALVLFGIESLDHVVGNGLGQFVAPEDVGRLLPFIDRVCRGEAGAIEYDLVGADGARRTVETRAVPLRRESTGSLVSLGATWDVTARKRAETSLAELRAKTELDAALHSAERRGFEDALNDAKAAHGDRARVWELERQKLETAVRAADERGLKLSAELTGECEGLKAALSEVKEQHEALAREWAAERDALSTNLQKLRDQGLLAELALERSHREHQATLAAEQDRYQTALNDLRTLTDRLSADSRAECDKLNELVGELERRETQFTKQRDAERAQLNDTLQAGQARFRSLLDEYDQMRAELSAIVRAAKDTSTLAEHVLNRRTQADDPLQDATRDSSDCRLPSPTNQDPAASAPEPTDESSWGF